MAQSLDLYIDVTKGELLTGGSAINGALPTLTRNDSYNLRVRLRERDSGGFLRDLNTSGISVKLGIGGVEDSPTDGQFKLTLGAVTSTAISFNATTTQVYNAISAIAGAGVSVATFGSITQGLYLITSATAGTALSFGGDAFTLFPTSSVLINTRRNPATGVPAQQVIKLVRNPAVYADTFTASPTAGIVSLTLLQNGSSMGNEIYNLTAGADAEGGSVVLNYGTNSTTAIALGATAASFREALSAVTGIGPGNISVDSGNGNYTISFVRDLGLQNITTALTLDTRGVIYGTFLQSAVTLNTAGIEELFAEASADEITSKLEVELTQSGTPKTILQTDVTVRKDLITTGSAVPAAQASYYTKAETNSLFIQNSATGVDAATQNLFDTSGNASVAWGNRTLYNSSYTPVLYWNNGIQIDGDIGFYGNAPTTKPSGVNIVSGLTNLGLLSYTQPTAVNVVSALTQTGLLVNNNTNTFGVFPLSSRTLTAITYTTFGLVSSNNVVSKTVTITGCQLNDIVLLGLPADVEEGLAFSGHVVAANQIHIDALNVTGSGKTQTATTFRITVIGY
jgi:hypothetical protein